MSAMSDNVSVLSIHRFHWLKKALDTTIQMLAIADLSTVFHTIVRKFQWYPEPLYNVTNSFLISNMASMVF